MYQVFGHVSPDLSISTSKHRTNEIPTGVEIRYYERASQLDQFDWFKPGYLWHVVQREKPELAHAIEAAPTCFHIQGHVSDPATLDYFRNVIGVITATLDSGGIVVFDPLMLKWWSPVEWRTTVFDPDEPLPHNHVVVLVSEDEEFAGTAWIHTRGMRKFGRPDLSIHGVPPSHRASVIDLCNRLIELQAFGDLIREGQVVTLSSLADKMTCHHGGDVDDPDFNNVHVEIRWRKPSMVIPGTHSKSPGDRCD